MDSSKDKNLEPENKLHLETTQKNQDAISYFKDDSAFVFVYKKTEKLATAVYLVTNLFSDNEPLKWSLRKKVSELLTLSLSYKDIFSEAQNNFVYDAKTRVLELISLLEISHKAGFVSEMNFLVLKQEFLALISDIDTTHSSSSQEIIPKNFFEVSKDTPKPAISAVQSRSAGDRNPGIVLKNKDFTLDTHTVKRSNRQNTILNLLKRKSNLTIKDMSEVIKDCSEKTIQRELNAFIASGVLKRVGERRWSRYSLA